MVQTVPASPKRSFMEVWLITIGHGLTHWYPATFYLLLPIIGNELGLSYTQIGFIVSFQYLASTISNIPGGMLVDMVGRKNLLMATSLFWVGLPYLILSVTNSYWLLLLCVALVGIGNNLWHPTAIPALSQRFPERKGFVLSIHGAGANLGDAVAPLAIGSILAILDWRQVVVVNVVPGVIMALIILFFLRNLQTARKKKPAEEQGKKEGVSFREYMSGIGALAKNKSLLLISTSSGFRAMTQSALVTFLPVYLLNELGYTPFALGVALFVLQGAGMVAALVSGALSDKIGRKKIIMSSMMMTAVVLIMMAVATDSSLFVFFIAALGFFLYAIRPVMQAWLMETTPKQMAGTSIGVLFGVQSLCSAVAPTLAGIAADYFGLFASFYFIAGTVLIANFLIFFMPKETMGGDGPSKTAAG